VFRPLSVLALIAAMLAASTSTAHADEAIEHEALIFYQAKNYGAAAAAFAAAYAHTHQDEDLFAWAQAERLWEQCDRALVLYRHYLSKNPPEANRQAAVQGMEACGAEEGAQDEAPLVDLMRKGYVLSQSPWFLLAEAYASESEQRCRLVRRLPAQDSPLLTERAQELAGECPEATDERPPVGPVQVPPPTTQVARSPSWYADPPVLMAIGGFGVAAIGAGLAFLGQKRIDDASTTSYRDFVDDVDAGKRLRIIGLVTAGVGLAAGSYGLIRILTRGELRTELRPGGATVSLAYEF